MPAHEHEPSELRTWAGAIALVGAAVSAEFAWLHARAIEAMGVICGDAPALHCGWCPTALALFGVGVYLLAGPRAATVDDGQGRQS